MMRKWLECSRPPSLKAEQARAQDRPPAAECHRAVTGPADVLSLFEQAVARGRGGANNPEGRNQHSKEEEVNPDNVRIDHPADAATVERDRVNEPPAGNSTQYAIRRLSRDRPDLLARVETGELSPHRAMVEAGFRKVPTALDRIKALVPRLTPEEREELRAMLATSPDAPRSH